MSTQVSATRQVFDHHLGALLGGDLEGIVSDYTEDSRVIAPDGVVKGRAAIEQLYAGYLATLFKPGTYTFEADVVHVDDDLVYVIWRASCTGADIVFATDTFVIRDGKIAVQTFAAKVEPHS